MAFWGMELTQADEFCLVYDEYMDLYDVGEEPFAITERLLEKYRDAKGNIPHHVCLAIAKAEWMLCAQSESVLLNVQKIIESGANIEYYRRLGFGENELAVRRDVLTRFWRGLQKPGKSAKKRRVSAYNHITRLPKGTVAWYAAEDGYYGFVVLDAVYEGRLLAVTKWLASPPQTRRRS